MAKYNEILVGRHNRFLQRFLSMKGGPPAAQLAGDIAAQFSLDSAMNLENRFIAGWRSWAQGGTPAAAAGNFCAARLHNPGGPSGVIPGGSGVIAVLEKCTISTFAADSPALLTGPVNAQDFAGSVNGVFRDIREALPSTGSVCRFSTANVNVSSGSTLWTAKTAGITTLDVILYENQEICLLPGDTATVWSNVVNQQITVAFMWRERALEEGELS